MGWWGLRRSYIKGKARFGGIKHKLANRITRDGDCIWYDLVDARWRAVKITADGWSVEENVPILFRRYSHQSPQSEPIMGGNVNDIFQFVNVTDETQKILFLVCVISFFIPNFPHPLLYIHGSQCSAKSTLSKIIRKLIDPSVTEVLSLPRQIDSLIQTLAHHSFLFFDNVSNISNEASDLLCKAITGAGFSKRVLYSDDDDMVYVLLSHIGINGINVDAERPDLLERSILLGLQRVGKGAYKQEKKLLEEFENLRPKILGAIFTIVSKTLSIKPTINLESPPRMADFATWGCAVAEAIGLPQQTFLDAYQENIASQHKEALANEPLVDVLASIVPVGESVTMTATTMLHTLKEETSDEARRYLPKAPNALSRKLGILQTNLDAIGFKISWCDVGGVRMITIQHVHKNIGNTTVSETSGDAMKKTVSDTSTDMDLESDIERHLKTLEQSDIGDTSDTF